MENVVVELPKAEQHEVIIYHARTHVPDDSEDHTEEASFDINELDLQTIVYQSLRENASASGSGGNHEIGQSSNGGNHSAASNILSQLASDEALARQFQFLEDCSGDAPPTVLEQQEDGESRLEASTVNDISTSTDTPETPAQVVSQDSVNVDAMSYEQLQSFVEERGSVSRGLSDELISYLKVLEYKCGFFSKKGKTEECVICRFNYGREKLLKLPCQHCYHSHCIKRWLKENRIILISLQISHTHKFPSQSCFLAEKLLHL